MKMTLWWWKLLPWVMSVGEFSGRKSIRVRVSETHGRPKGLSAAEAKPCLTLSGNATFIPQTHSHSLPVSCTVMEEGGSRAGRFVGNCQGKQEAGEIVVVTR